MKRGLSTTKISLLALFGSASYATLRYNIFQHVAWSDWSVYVLNKALALSALVLLVLAVVLRARHAKRSDMQLLQAAGLFGLVHVFLSLTILSPAYFDKFFVNGRFTAEAGWSILLGVAAAALMAAGAAGMMQAKGESALKLPALVGLMVGLHAAFQGYSGWFAPAAWPGWMPPITLISFLLGIAAVIAALGPALHKAPPAA